MLFRQHLPRQGRRNKASCPMAQPSGETRDKTLRLPDVSQDPWRPEVLGPSRHRPRIKSGDAVRHDAPPPPWACEGKRMHRMRPNKGPRGRGSIGSLQIDRPTLRAYSITPHPRPFSPRRRGRASPGTRIQFSDDTCAGRCPVIGNGYLPSQVSSASYSSENAIL